MAGDPLVFTNDEDFDADRLNAAFLALNLRLKAQEGLTLDYRGAIEALQAIGLQRLNTALQPVYEALTGLAQLGAIFTTTSPSAVTVGPGSRSFVVAEADRARFAAAAYLGVQAIDDPGTMLFGALQSYDRSTGTLVIGVTQVHGQAGASLSSWRISATAAPDFVATAHGVGAYTQAEVDAAVGVAKQYATLQAVGVLQTLRGDVVADGDTLAKLYALIGGLAKRADDDDTAIGSLKKRADDGEAAVAARLRGDAAGNYTAAQIGQFLDNLGIAAPLKTVLGKATAAAALTALGGQAALGFTPVQQGGGPSQLSNTVKIGHDGTAPRIAVDAVDFDQIWSEGRAGGSFGTAGYQKFPSGLIVQWGTLAGNSPCDQFIALPTSYPNVQLGALATLAEEMNGTSALIASIDQPTKTGIALRRRVIFRPDNGGALAISTADAVMKKIQFLSWGY